MKVIESHGISSFGGLNFVIQELDRKKIGHLLNEYLPELKSQSVYDWREIIYSFWAIFFCGGTCIEDLSINLRRGFKNNPLLKFPSPDCLLNRMKKLAIETDPFTSYRSTKIHEFSRNDFLNRLNLQVLNKLGLLHKSSGVLDYDNTFIFCNKADANMTYKRKNGYNPGVATIDGNVVYVENRNGNSGAHILQEHTLERMFEVLLQENIKIEAFRADSATCHYSSLVVLNKYVEKIYVRPRMSQALSDTIKKIKKWKSINTKDGVVYRGETLFTPFLRISKTRKESQPPREYRLIITKERRKDNQINLFTDEAFIYSGVLTTDFNMDMDSVVHFYNQRGASEKEFDILKNDFGWNSMSFSHLQQNTVFLILTAMCRNIYNHMILKFSIKSELLKPYYRIKKFIFRFICIPSKWIKSGRAWHLKLYGKINFQT
jgi:hypothetical protein